MIRGTKGNVTFRSRIGMAVKFVPIGSLTTNLGVTQAIKFDNSLVNFFRMRGWKVQVPGIALRIRGTITADHVGAGDTLLKCSKDQRLSFFEVGIVPPGMEHKPIYSSPLNLLQLAYMSRIVNPQVEMLDQDFSAADGVVKGGFPAQWVPPDLGIASGGLPTGNGPLATMNRDNYPSVDRRDCYWRQLEGLVPVRDPSAATVTAFDDVQVIPLCCLTKNPLFDSIPLDTLCDLTSAWQVTVRYAPDGMHMNQSIVGFNGGTTSFDAGAASQIDLYAICIMQREEDARYTGLPWYAESNPAVTADIVYPEGKIILFSGNLPACGSQLVDTVDAQAYQMRVAFGNFSPDKAAALQVDWYLNNQSWFPPLNSERPMRDIIDLIHNRRSHSHILRYLASGTVMTRAGRALVGVLGYANQVDALNLGSLLGPISPEPVRVLVETAPDLKGIPGLGSLDQSGCKTSVKLTGGFDFDASHLSSLNATASGGLWTIYVNNAKADLDKLQKLGQNCCGDEKVPWVPTADSSSPKQGLVAGIITPWKQREDALAPSDSPATGGAAVSSVPMTAADKLLKKGQ